MDKEEEANLYLMNPWHVLMNLVDMTEEKAPNEEFVTNLLKKVKDTEAAVPGPTSLLVPTNSRVFGYAPKRRFFW